MATPEKDPAAATPTAQSTEAASKTPSTKTDWKAKFLELEAKLKAQTETSQVQSPPISSFSKPDASSAPNPHSHTENEPHFIGSWQKYCPTCGDQNPDFQDEVECSDCHTHLGAEATAQKLKACPNCGGKHARKLKK